MTRWKTFGTFIAFASVLLLTITLLGGDSPSPRKVLVVTTTLGFRHSSIPTAEKVIADLAAKSGAFTVDFVQQPADPKKDMAKAMAKLAPSELAAYDAVVFANTTGDLPIPDKAGFLEWLRSGKAFIGMHSASDTFHGWPEFIDMLGGEFRTHGAQVGVDCINCDRAHPANAHLGDRWPIKIEEIYLFKNYEPSRVHELLVLDKHPNEGTPGHYPVSWCREYGKGKVMYTSLGHREDVWESEPYQKHILGGILWALGLKEGDATPQAKAEAKAESATATR